MNNKFYGVDPASIKVTEVPPYVRSDIVSQVYKDTAMDGLSLLDTQATAKIASAFSTHPWVKQVNSVRKLPGGVIDVRMEYRRPVAMFPVEKSRHPEYNGPGFFPLDGEGVLLPRQDFRGEEAQRDYIHIIVLDPNLYPTGQLGGRFGNSQVEAAASLAAIIAPYRDKTGTKTIGIYGDPRQSLVPQLEIELYSGKKKFWGSPPGMELPGEPKAISKLQMLLTTGDENVDLRMAKAKTETEIH